MQRPGYSILDMLSLLQVILGEYCCYQEDTRKIEQVHVDFHPKTITSAGSRSATNLPFQKTQFPIPHPRHLHLRRRPSLPLVRIQRCTNSTTKHKKAHRDRWLLQLGARHRPRLPRARLQRHYGPTKHHLCHLCRIKRRSPVRSIRRNHAPLHRRGRFIAVCRPWGGHEGETDSDHCGTRSAGC